MSDSQASGDATERRDPISGRVLKLDGSVAAQTQAMLDALRNLGNAFQSGADAAKNVGRTVAEVAKLVDRAMLPVRDAWHSRHFAITKNPLHAWHAYRLHRQAGHGIPDWVLLYMDVAADAVFEVGNSGAAGIDIAPKISAALGFKKPGRSGAGTAFSQFDEHDQWLSYAIDIRLEREAGGQETYAIEAAAKKHGVSSSTVRRAWLHAKAVFPAIFQ